MAIKDIKLEKLKDISDKEFEEFGYIIGREDPTKDWVAITPDFVGYTNILPFLNDEPGQLSMGMLVVKEKPLGELVLWCEYHEGCLEFFFPLGGKQVVFVMAPPGPAPDLEKTRAFVIGPNEGIMIKRGVWHHPPYGLSETTKCLMPRYGNYEVIDGRLSDAKTIYYGEEYRGYTGNKIGEFKIRVIL